MDFQAIKEEFRTQEQVIQDKFRQVKVILAET